MNLNRIFIFLGLAVLSLTILNCSPSLPAVTMEENEQILADIDLNTWVAGNFKVSPDNRTFAYLNNVNNKLAIVINGKVQKLYDELLIESLIFSPDNKHVVYSARSGDKWFMIIDGKETGAYEQIPGRTAYSPDSQRLLYTIKRNEKYYVVIDGRENGPYDLLQFGEAIFTR